MRRGPRAGFFVTELSATLALPLGYGVAGGGCAPPGILCYTRDVLCPAVCTEAWAQFPMVAAYGAVIGVVPSLLVALLAFGIERRRGPQWTASRSVAMPVLGIMGVLVAILLVVVVFPSTGGYLMALVAGFGVVSAAAFGGGYVLAERMMSRESRQRGG